jgi:mono/diheme cytochrome c family protein
MAAPMTYSVDSVQYVAVQVGYGGTGIGVGSIPPTSAALKYENVNRIIAFRLDGGDVPKPPVRKDEPFPKPPANEASPAEIQAGETKFIEQCSRCHTLGPNITPDLRKMPLEVHDMFKDILLGGACARRGMESFGDILSGTDVENIHVVQSIAYRTLSGDPFLVQASKTFGARLQALGRANRQLTNSNWNGIALRELLRLELEPYGNRATIEGADVMIGPQRAHNVALALHELATNAVKYGALSNGSWQERGGPIVVTPTRRGFGTAN